MPNHVHLLAAFANEEAMLSQCESWKHYTARAINRARLKPGEYLHEATELGLPGGLPELVSASRGAEEPSRGA
jgi:hypothetical protein